MLLFAGLNNFMGGAEWIEVEVAYATPQRQQVITIKVPAGSSAIDAVRCSGILHAFPEIDLTRVKLGVYSRRIDPNQAVRAGDRIEIYRLLLTDPQRARRVRARSVKGKKPLGNA